MSGEAITKCHESRRKMHFDCDEAAKALAVLLHGVTLGHQPVYPMIIEAPLSSRTPRAPVVLLDDRERDTAVDP